MFCDIQAKDFCEPYPLIFCARLPKIDAARAPESKGFRNKRKRIAGAGQEPHGRAIRA
jgi:hypothetical protein